MARLQVEGSFEIVRGPQKGESGPSVKKAPGA